MSHKSNHPELLNSLVDMQASLAYALRKGVLAEAERVIVDLEQRLAKYETIVEPRAILDERLKAAGMIKLSDILDGKPSPLMLHAGVTDIYMYQKWLVMRREEALSLQTQLTLDGKEDDELFSWALAHAAVFAECLHNLRQAVGGGS